MPDRPKVTAFFVDDEIAPDDPLRAVNLRARQLCDPHYQAGQSAARLAEATELFGCESMDPGTVRDTALAAGLTDADMDAAAYVAAVLARGRAGAVACSCKSVADQRFRRHQRVSRPVRRGRRGPGRHPGG